VQKKRISSCAGDWEYGVTVAALVADQFDNSKERSEGKTVRFRRIYAFKRALY
jgi:hypothetical protein